MHLNLFNSAKKLILGQILVDVKGLVITKKKFIRLFVAIYEVGVVVETFRESKTPAGVKL